MTKNRGALVERAAEGDHQSFSQLVRTHDEQMRSLAYRILGSQSAMDDALQSAYLNAFRHINTFKGDAPFAAWLRRIVVNCCRDIQRQQQRTNEVSLDQLTLAGHDVGDQQAFEESVSQADEIQQSLHALTEDQREAVVLVNGQGLSYSEAAQVCGVAEGTIGSRLTRAHEVLRAQLERSGIQNPETQNSETLNLETRGDPDAQPDRQEFS